jgi:phosphatidylserine/phosphatidylglycerophosphate/cardiolipin synthase-like enzyme
MKPILLSLFLSVTVHAADIQVFFSPKGGCTEAIVDNLCKATNTVLVQAYSFTSSPIAKAIVDARKRGVYVQVILDKSNLKDKYSAADFTLHAGIPTFIDTKHQIAHNKIIVIDGKTILTGSFNFSKAAEENNAENLLVITHDTELVSKYTGNWQAHLKHSVKYTGKAN